MPTMGLNTAVVDDFSGGLNYVDRPSELESNEYTIAENLRVVGGGKALEVRPGVQAYGIELLLGGASGTLERIYPWIYNTSGDGMLLLSIGGSLYSAPIDASSYTLEKAGTSTWETVFAQDSTGVARAYSCNGVETPQRTDTSRATVDWPGIGTYKPATAEYWKSYLVIAGGNLEPGRVRFSNSGNPEVFTSTDFVDLAEQQDESDPILKLKVYGDDLWVFKAKSIWRITAPPPDVSNLKVFDLGLARGFPLTTKYESVVVLDNTLYFLSENGLYSTNGAELKLESRKINPNLIPGSFWLGMNPRIPSVLAGDAGDSAIYEMFPNVVDDRGESPWTKLQIGTPGSIRCSAIYKVASGDDRVLLGYYYLDGALAKNKIGIVELDPVAPIGMGYQDMNSSEAVVGWFQSRFLPIQGVENIERVRRVNLDIEGVGDNLQVDVTTAAYTDSSTDFVSSVETVAVQSGVNVVRTRPETRGRFHSVAVKTHAGVENAGWILNAAELKYRGGKEH